MRNASNCWLRNRSIDGTELVYYEIYGCTANRSDTEKMLAILGQSDIVR